MKRFFVGLPLILVIGICALQPTFAAEGRYVVKPLVSKKVEQLPPGPVYWRVENFPTLVEAQAVADAERWNPDTVSSEPFARLAAQVAGKAWLFTLGPKGGATPGGTKVAEIGPLPTITAKEYLLRVNHGYGPPGAKTKVHSHPGSEAFYVVAGRLGQRTTKGVNHVTAGHTMNGNPADMPMEVFNSGTTDLTALIMFVVDANRPFSTPAKLP